MHENDTDQSVYFCHEKMGEKDQFGPRRSLLLLGEESPQGEADDDHDYEPEQEGHDADHRGCPEIPCLITPKRTDGTRYYGLTRRETRRMEDRVNRSWLIGLALEHGEPTVPACVAVAVVSHEVAAPTPVAEGPLTLELAVLDLVLLVDRVDVLRRLLLDRLLSPRGLLTAGGGACAITSSPPQAQRGQPRASPQP